MNCVPFFTGFFAVPRGCLQFVIVVLSDHTHLLFLYFVHFLRLMLPALAAKTRHVIMVRPEFFYELIYEPSYCNFPESR